MAHPYPSHHPALPYKGRHHYFLTFCADQRRRVFTEPATVHLVWTQFLRAANERGFEITAYCFMPDHVHMTVHGLAERANCKAFIKSAKQYSGYYFKQRHDNRLWQRYGFERVIRDDTELALTIGYIVGNPVRAGLVGHPSQYPHLGSQRYTVAELTEICGYRGGAADVPPEGGSHTISNSKSLEP